MIFSVKERMIKVLGVALMLASFTVQADMTFKIASIAPDGTRWMIEMRAAADEIKLQTEGRVRFKFYPGGVMGNDASVMRKIRIGQLHGAAFTAGGLREIYPDIRIYGLPMIFASLEEVDYVRERMDPIFESGMEQAGFVNFGFAEGGFALLMASKAIRDSETLRDTRAWIPEGDTIAYAAIEALGVSPIVLPMTDVLTGLQTGLISTVAASTLAAIAFQWHTRIKYVTDIPISYLMGIFAIDKRAFDRVEPADQAIIREVFSTLFDRLNELNRVDDYAARAALKEQGIEFLQPTDEVVEEWRANARTVIEQKGREGAFDPALANEVFDLIEEFRRQEVVLRDN